MSDWPEAQDSTAPIKRRMMTVQEPGKRLNPELTAHLVEFARIRIQMVWDDAGVVDAQTLAENVVSAQEWLWLSLHFPVTLADHDRRIKAEAAADALEKAADEIRQQMGENEVALHLLSRESQLPMPSQHMLNGGTRFAERLRERASEIRKATPDDY